MIGYEDLIARIRGRAGIGDNATAEKAARAAVSTVTGYLPADESRYVADTLPPRLSGAVHRPERGEATDVTDAADAADATDATDAAGLVDDLARRLHEDRDRARYLLQGVVSALQDAEPALVDRLQEALPGALGELAGAPVATAEPISSRRLTHEEVAQELRRLAAWTGDAHRIQRAVTVPPDRRDMLIDQVRQAADEQKEHLEIGRTDDGCTLTVYTASVDAVTPDDLAFAARLDEIIDAAPYISR